MEIKRRRHLIDCFPCRSLFITIVMIIMLMCVHPIRGHVYSVGGTPEKATVAASLGISCMIFSSEDKDYLAASLDGMAIKTVGNIFELMKEALEGKGGSLTCEVFGGQKKRIV